MKSIYKKNFKVKYSKHKTVNIDYLMKYTTSKSSLGERMFRLKKKHHLFCVSVFLYINALINYVSLKNSIQEMETVK